MMIDDDAHGDTDDGKGYDDAHDNDASDALIVAVMRVMKMVILMIADDYDGSDRVDPNYDR